MPRPVFRSQTAREKLFSRYDDLLTRWPVPHKSLFVQTSFGSTHVIKTGTETGPSLILLHPYHSNSALWMENAAALSRDTRVYAIDILGDAGKSEPEANLPFGFDRPWLLQIMDSLFIDRTDIVAMGGACQMALNLASYVPDRIRRVVMISAGLDGMRPQRNLARVLKKAQRFPTNRNVRALLSLTAPTLEPDHDLIDYQAAVLKSARLPDYPVFKPDLFDGAKPQSPALLLVGERDVVFDPKKALQIGRVAFSEIETDTVPEVGHLMTIERPLVVSDRIRRFLRS
jgi:pimeloyl-ACP methyl ester carboxylesterase